MTGASERAKGRASDPVLTSGFLFVPDHSASVGTACYVFAAPWLKKQIERFPWVGRKAISIFTPTGREIARINNISTPSGPEEIMEKESLGKKVEYKSLSGLYRL